MRILKWLIIAAFVVYSAVFSIFNKQIVSVNFPPSVYVNIPLYLFFFITVISGVLLGGVTVLFHKIGSHRKVVKIKKKMKVMEREIESLRLESKINDSINNEVNSEGKI